MSIVEKPPECLQYDLAHGLLFNMRFLRRLVGRPKHIPGNDECHEIARPLIEVLKENGVERIVRRELESDPAIERTQGMRERADITPRLRRPARRRLGRAAVSHAGRSTE